MLSQEITFSINAKPNKWLNSTLSYSVLKSRYNAFGAGLNLKYSLLSLSDWKKKIIGKNLEVIRRHKKKRAINTDSPSCSALKFQLSQQTNTSFICINQV